MVRKGATLGANCTIVCGTTIGAFAFIGAGAVVNKDVPAYALMVGVPARQIGWMSEYGEQVPLLAMARANTPALTPANSIGSTIKPWSASANEHSFIDLKVPGKLQLQIQARINAVLEHGQYIMGPEVRELEERLEAYTSARHCITVASGTEAPPISLMALGIGPGDEIITTPFTFVRQRR